MTPASLPPRLAGPCSRRALVRRMSASICLNARNSELRLTLAVSAPSSWSLVEIWAAASAVALAPATILG